MFFLGGGEIHNFTDSDFIKSVKEYMQKILRQHYCS